MLVIPLLWLPVFALAAPAADHAPVADSMSDAGPSDLEVLTIVPRAAWDPHGTPHGVPYPSSPKRTLTRIVVHHSDFLEPPGPEGIKQYHLDVSGFSDIGYHYVIEPDGTVYEGRPLTRMGAHAGATREGSRGDHRADPDWGSVGIVLDGYFAEQIPPESQRRALVALVRQLRGELPRVTEVIGHREVRTRVEHDGLHPTSDVTVCPGDALYGWLEDERQKGTFDAPPAPSRAHKRVR